MIRLIAAVEAYTLLAIGAALDVLQGRTRQVREIEQELASAQEFYNAALRTHASQLSEASAEWFTEAWDRLELARHKADSIGVDWRQFARAKP